jgi:hypothetical protein
MVVDSVTMEEEDTKKEAKTCQTILPRVFAC